MFFGLKSGLLPDHEHSECSGFQYECIYVHTFIYVCNDVLYMYYIYILYYVCISVICACVRTTKSTH
jgi:hypothetical protein